MSLFRSLASLATSAFGAGGSRYIPPPDYVAATELSTEADEFLTACNTEFNAKQERFTQQWLGDCERYDLDFERGLLRITRRSAAPVYFDALFVGSHNRARGSWEWAWNNPNAKASPILPKSALAAIGKAFDLRYLLSGFVPVPLDSFPWYLCGIALKVAGGTAVYMASEGHMEYYLLLDNPCESD